MGLEREALVSECGAIHYWWISFGIQVILLRFLGAFPFRNGNVLNQTLKELPTLQSPDWKLVPPRSPVWLKDLHPLLNSGNTKKICSFRAKRSTFNVDKTVKYKERWVFQQIQGSNENVEKFTTTATKEAGQRKKVQLLVQLPQLAK